MNDLDNKYFDLYKDVDSIVKDAYQNEKGISYYIEFMGELDEGDYQKCCRVPDWKQRRKTLKHLKWVRNQISHEKGKDFANQDDYNDLIVFKNELLDGSDPLAEYRKYNADEFKNDNSNYYEAHKTPEKLNLGALWLVPILIMVAVFALAIVHLM